MTKNYILSTLFFILAAFSMSAQVYFSDNFETGDFSAGWTNTFTGTGGWEVENTPANWTTIPDGNGYYALFDDDAYGNGSVDSGIMTSPVINLTGATSVVLSFDFFNRQYETISNITAEVYDGSSWVEVFYWDTYTADETNTYYDWNNTQIDISSYVNSNFQVRFLYDDAGDWSYGAAIDNVRVETLLNNNVAVMGAEIDTYIVINQDNMLDVTLTNVGGNEITSLSLSWFDGTAHEADINQSIAVGETVTIEHPIPVNYSDLGAYSITISADVVNGVNDSDESDNSVTISTTTISQDAGTKTLIEEGTGTWCGWCPRGFVAMEYMDANFADDFVGIAIHNGDPMTNSAYDSAADFSGYPGMNVDREILGASVSSASMEDYVIDRSARANPIAIDAFVNMLTDTRELIVNASATFYTNFASADFRLAAILVEDGVTGSSSGYSQTNYYAGGANGAMGGWESLPSTVSYTQMVYDHVGRQLLGGYNGVSGSVPTTLTNGQTASYTFNYTVPSSYDENELKVVVLVIDNTTGFVVNVEQFDVALNLSVGEQYYNSFTMFPNPAKNTVHLKGVPADDYQIVIYDISGKMVYQEDKTFLNQEEEYSLNISQLAAGSYTLSLQGSAKSLNKKLVVY